MSKLIPVFRLKIIHIGLILVSVPLAFGLISTLCLNYALKESIQSRKQMTRIAIASAAINKFVTDSVRFDSDYQLQAQKKSPNKLKLESEAEQLHSDLVKLEGLSERHIQYEAQLQELIPAARDLTATVDSLMEKESKPDMNEELQRNIDRLEILAEDHATLLQVGAEIGKQPTGSIEEFITWLIAANSNRDQSIQQLLAWLIGANIIACPILVLYFSQNVVRRLRVLIANTERLEQDKELLHPIAGDDEIAHLDQVFRTMANKLRASRAEKEEIERMRKEYVAMIGHDLRTPLTAVQGTLTLLADGVYGDISDSGISKAKVAEQSINRLTNLANELLDVEKLESNKLPITLEPVSLQSAITDSIKSLEGFALYKNVSVNSQKTDLEVMADQNRLVQIIVNLLSNAIKFSNDGDTVEVTASVNNHGLVQVNVTDKGRGVSPEKRLEIFDRFKQAETSDAQNERGLGLGLAICKALVESHGGTIGVNSSDEHHTSGADDFGKGSSFWFTLKPAQHKITIEQAQKQEVLNG